jgi:hypothetical protein
MAVSAAVNRHDARSVRVAASASAHDAALGLAGRF